MFLFTILSTVKIKALSSPLHSLLNHIGYYCMLRDAATPPGKGVFYTMLDVTFVDCCYAEVLLDITCGLGGLYCIKLNPD